MFIVTIDNANPETAKINTPDPVLTQPDHVIALATVLRAELADLAKWTDVGADEMTRQQITELRDDLALLIVDIRIWEHTH